MIDLSGQDLPQTADAAPVGEAPAETPQVDALRRGLGGAFFWTAASGLIGVAAGVWVWDFLWNMVARGPVLGAIATVLSAVVVLGVLIAALREGAALGRMARLGRLQRQMQQARARGDRAGAEQAADRLIGLYHRRDDMRWALARFQDARGDQPDAQGLLDLAELGLMAPLDQQGLARIEAAAKQVAGVTAFVPLALVDVVAVLLINLRMIRQIAGIYGGRPGTLASLRLLRRIVVHLAATGMLALGDDMLEPLIGGTLMAKLSRRLGEGVINGALTARVGLAALDLCRPMPFAAAERPGLRSLIKNSLGGLVKPR
jgi:putative membrane protein